MLSKYNWMSLATGVLLIIAAVYMFANPAVPLAALGFIFSFAVLLGGVFELVRYFGALKPARTGWDLVNGLLTVLGGHDANECPNNQPQANEGRDEGGLRTSRGAQ